VSCVSEVVSDSLRVKQLVLADAELLDRCEAVVDLMINAFRADQKVLFCGNGGSAADAQHLAAELSGRYAFDRPPLYAEALHVNSSYMTAVANDYSYDEVFARLVRGCGRRGDVLFAISTSGNSANVLRAAEEAVSIGMHVVAMTGESGGKLRDVSDVILDVPSNDTPRIQECHILLGHTICGLVEERMFGPA
jgi:D-sedoheptulose 7-phosphate isomerase